MAKSELVKKLKGMSKNNKMAPQVERLLQRGFDAAKIAKRLQMPVAKVDAVAATFVSDLAKKERAHRAEIKLINEENDKLRCDIENLEALQETVRHSCVALNPVPMVYRSTMTSSKTRSTASLILGDWHIGNYISKRQIEGINEFNLRMATHRVDFLGDKFLHNINTMRAGFKIDELVIMCVGDFISGGIHKELDMFNEFSPPEQAVKAGGLLGNLIVSLAPHFEHVRVVAQNADNHGRLYPKPMAKSKGAHNYNVVVNAVMEQMTSKCKNVRVEVQPGMKGVIKVESTKFLTQHGDVIKGWQGIPHYGIEREKNREKVKRMVFRRLMKESEGIDFDVMVIGHFHEFNWREEIIVNGSLTGTDEYDHASGRFGMPHQVSFLVHPRHGVHSFNRWILA